MFLEVKAASTSIERTLGITGGTTLRHIMFVIIESGMALFAIQLVRVLLSFLQSATSRGTLDFVIGIHEMFNVTIRSVHSTSFILLITFTWLGDRTNNNFGADFNEIVLRRQRILQGSRRKSSF